MQWVKVDFRAAVACVVLGLLSFSAHAGIVVNDQQRQIHIEGQALDNFLSGPELMGTPFSDTQAAQPFAPFNQTVSDQSMVTRTSPGGSVQIGITASASQNSTLTSDGQSLHLVASGAIQANAASDSIGKTLSSYFVVFTIDAPGVYSLTETAAEPFSNPDVFSVGAQLYSGTQPPPPYLPTAPLTATSITPQLQNTEFTGPQTFTGSLQPGTYTLAGQALGIPEDELLTGDYSVDFSVTTSAAASVPLPNAASMGLFTLAIMLGGLFVRRRSARHNYPV